MSYEDFLASKHKSVPGTGFEPGPMGDFLSPFQKDVVRWGIRRGRAAFFEAPGLGKAQPVSEPVLTPSGWRPIGDLVPGDHVMGADGRPTEVVGVFPQGMRQVYRIVFNDGSQTRCDGQHLWTVSTDARISKNVPWQTMTLDAICAAGLRVKNDGRLRWRVPMVTAIENPTRDLPVDPYLLGVLLGDGYLRRSIEFCKPDEWMASEISRRLPGGLRLTKRVNEDRAQVWGIVSDAQHDNPIRDALNGMGLMGKTAERKFIPQEYIHGSVAQRVDLLHGLMDTDGYASRDGMIAQFSSSSKALADGLVALVRSLGGHTRMHSKIPTYVYLGERRHGQRHYTVTVALPPHINPFASPIKSTKYKARTKYMPQRKILSVEPVGCEMSVCIMVDAADKLYVTTDYIVTHNTRQAAEWSRQVVAHTGMPVLILAPLGVTSQTVAEGATIGIPCAYARSQEQADTLIAAGTRIIVTNYEMLPKFDARRFGGIVIDESGRLKDDTSAFRNLVIETFAQTPFKLACSATPAPNDHTELGNHAEFLGIMTRTEMLSMFFVHDGGSTQDWRLKGHAEAEFWRWVSSWGAMVQMPSDLGYPDDGYVKPPIEYRQHIIPFSAEEMLSQADEKGQMKLVPEAASTLSEQRKAKRDSLAKRVEIVREIVLSSPSEQFVVWCELNPEQDAIAKAIPSNISIFGSMKPEAKVAGEASWRAGLAQTLVTKGSLFGWGMNWQHCHRTIFAGADHSYEKRFQSICRFHRFGQRERVIVDLIASEAEGKVVENMRRKEADAAVMAEAMGRYTREFVRANVQGAHRETTEYRAATPMVIPAWLGA